MQDTEAEDPEFPIDMEGHSKVPAKRSFTELLATHFKKYGADKYRNIIRAVGYAPEKTKDFIAAVNQSMKDAAGRNPVRQDPFHPLTEELFDLIREDKIGITPELLHAMAMVLPMGGNEREDFLERGQEVVARENSLRHDDWLVTPEGKAITFAKTVAEETELQNVARKRLLAGRNPINSKARANNPTGLNDAPSFQEMLETSISRNEDFRTFLFQRVLPTWNNMSQVAFCAHLQARNKRHGGKNKATISDTVLSNWHSGKAAPLRESVDVMCRAFGIAPLRGEVMAEHEKMLWKLIGGHEFIWKNTRGIAAIEMAIEECSQSGETRDLVKELISASGIRSERLEALLHVQQLPPWMRGAKIKDVDMARQFLELVNPQPSEALTGKISRQNRLLLSLITGRELDWDNTIEHAQQQGYPGGALFVALTGRHGMVSIAPNTISQEFKKAGLDHSELRIHKMRTSTQLQRGGKITENDGKIILAIVKRYIAPWVKRGICAMPTKEQEERCIETFTGVPHPKKLLQATLKKELTVGEMVSKICERRGINKSVGEDSFQQQVGFSNMSDFTLGKSNLTYGTAQKMANWLAKNYGFNSRKETQFILLARGMAPQLAADAIIADVRAGKIDRSRGLGMIYDQSGLTRDGLADRAKVPTRTIQYSVTQVSGGRIMAGKDALERIARLCGVSEPNIEEFVELYSGRKVERQDAMTWRNHVASGRKNTIRRK